MTLQRICSELSSPYINSLTRVPLGKTVFPEFFIQGHTQKVKSAQCSGVKRRVSGAFKKDLLKKKTTNNTNELTYKIKRDTDLNKLMAAGGKG